MSTDNNVDSDVLDIDGYGDKHYKRLLSHLKSLILRLTCPIQTYLCEVWIERFLKCDPHTESNARNTLIGLLTEQLQSGPGLKHPFNSIANTDLPLNEIVDIAASQPERHSTINENKSKFNSPRSFDSRPSSTNKSLYITDSQCQYIGTECVAQIKDLNKFINELTQINRKLQSELDTAMRERNCLLRTNAEWQMKCDQLSRTTQTLIGKTTMCQRCIANKSKLKWVQTKLDHCEAAQTQLKDVLFNEFCREYICNPLEHLLQRCLVDAAEKKDEFLNVNLFQTLYDHVALHEDIKTDLHKLEDQIREIFVKKLSIDKMDWPVATTAAAAAATDSIVSSVSKDRASATAAVQSVDQLKLVRKFSKYVRRIESLQGKLIERNALIDGLQRNEAIKEKAMDIRMATMRSHLLLHAVGKNEADMNSLISSMDARFKEFLERNRNADST